MSIYVAGSNQSLEPSRQPGLRIPSFKIFIWLGGHNQFVARRLAAQ